MQDHPPPRASIGARRNPETEAAVLDAAAALILEQGYGALTMEAVARRAQAGKATLYRWWPSCGHLLLALYSRSKADLAAPDTGTLRGDLIAHVAAILGNWHGQDGRLPAAQLACLVIASAQMDPTVQAALDEERRTKWFGLNQAARRAAARGELAEGISPTDVAERVISLLWYRLLNGTLPKVDAAEPLVDLAMAGLLKSKDHETQYSNTSHHDEQ